MMSISFDTISLDEVNRRCTDFDKLVSLLLLLLLLQEVEGCDEETVVVEVVDDLRSDDDKDGVEMSWCRLRTSELSKARGGNEVDKTES